MAKPFISCSRPDCHRTVERRGLCSKHYDELRAAGLPTLDPPHVRMWARVDKSGGPDACWIWQGARNDRGYGQIRQGRSVLYTHRMALESVSEPAQSGLFALHRCDNPPCCNPSHLSWGKASDNMRDCVAKGRNKPNRGELSGRSILTEESVIAIRQLSASGRSNSSLAKQFGVHTRTVRGVVMRENWTHIP